MLLPLRRWLPEHSLVLVADSGYAALDFLSRVTPRKQALTCRLLFEDEVRFGRMVEPRRAWTPPDLRPLVAPWIEREYGYAYAAGSPHDSVLDSLVLPEVNAELISLFLAEVARVHLPGAGRSGLAPGRQSGHSRADALVSAAGSQPGVKPAEHVWEELREKWMHNHPFQS